MDYLTQARARATRRKSPWNLLLIPAVVVPWLLLWGATSVALGKLYSFVHPAVDFVLLPDTVGGILMAVAPLFAWLAPAMIVGNFLVSLVPPARLVLDSEAAMVPGTGRAAANRGLRRFSLFVTPAGLVLGLLGVLL